MAFSDILRDLRKEKKLTQKELATFLGLTANSICEWENQRSEPSMASILKMCTLFEVSTDYLLGRTDDFGAVPVLPTAPQLSKNDRELVEAYHTLSPDLQRLLWEQIRLWQRNADAMSAATKKKA